MSLLLRLAGYRRLKVTLSRLIAVAPLPTDAPAEAMRITRLVSMAATHCPVPSTCLSRSLTLWLLLRPRGVDADICLGVRGGSPRLYSHAWVEYRGQPLSDPDDVRDHYAVIDGAKPSA